MPISPQILYFEKLSEHANVKFVESNRVAVKNIMNGIKSIGQAVTANAILSEIKDLAVNITRRPQA